MILRKGSVPARDVTSNYPGPYNLGAGNLGYAALGDAAGLTQYGVNLETLHPGGQSSQMHWESHEDEFLYMLTGEITVVEDGEETVIGPGDAVGWAAGSPVAHCLKNHTATPATYLIMGTRHPDNVARYPGLDLMVVDNSYVHLDGTPWAEGDEPRDV